MQYNSTPGTDAFTQGCRNFIRSLTYEAILACTVYVPPMLFMIGPAAIMANHPLTLVVLHSVLGFGLSCVVHGMGHCLLVALPQAPQKIYLSPSIKLPVKLTVGQFAWMLEGLVGAGALCGLLGKRVFASDPTTGAMLFSLGIALYFLPVYLTNLWSKRYFPAITLCSPTDELINKSFPSLRSLFR